MAQESLEGLVDFAANGEVAASDDAPSRVIMLEFRQKGVAVLFTYPEALALGRALRTMGKGEHRILGCISGSRDEKHAHEHQVVEIIDTDTVTDYEQSSHRIITLRLHHRGFSLDLDFGEAIALTTVMEKVVDHVNAKQQQ